MCSDVPRLRIVCANSSVLSLRGNKTSLSQHGLRCAVCKLSFHRCLSLQRNVSIRATSLSGVVHNRICLPGGRHPLRCFSRCLGSNCCPFFERPNFLSHLGTVVGAALRASVPSFTKFKVSATHGLGQLVCVVTRDTPFGPGTAGVTGSLRVDQGALGSVFTCLRGSNVVSRLHASIRNVDLLNGMSGVCLSGPGVSCTLARAVPSVNGVHRAFFGTMVHIARRPLTSHRTSFAVSSCAFRIKKGGGNVHRVTNVGGTFVIGSSVRATKLRALPL